MLDHMILTVSDIKRSLAFYEPALKPLHIKFFVPYKGEDGHPESPRYRPTERLGEDRHGSRDRQFRGCI